MPEPQETWAEIARRFDPEQPARPEWHVDRDHSPATEILRRLDADVPIGTPRFLLMGTIGTGKTTELLTVAEERARAGKEFVIFLDLVQHFAKVVGDQAALENVQPWEVCLLVGLALIRAAEERLGYKIDKDLQDQLESAWRTLAQANATPGPGPEIDVGKAAKSLILQVAGTVTPGGAVVKTSLDLLAALVEGVKWSLGRSQRPALDQESGPANLLASVNGILGAFRHWGCPVLFVIDGLDFIKQFDHARALFLDSGMIGNLDARLVVSAPFAMRHHIGGTTVRGFRPTLTLVNAPVMDQRSPAKHGEGIAFLCDLYRRRIEDLPKAADLIDPRDLERLAYYSGGRGRDFVKFIQELAAEAWHERAPRITSALVDMVIDNERRQREAGLRSEDFALLTQIVEDPKHRLPDDPRVNNLLTYARLLPYSNGSEWYYPHPLLTLTQIKIPTGSSG